MEVYVFILNKFNIENSVESNRNPGYYTLVARYYLYTIPNHSSFWYRTIIVNEELKKEIIRRSRYGVQLCECILANTITVIYI